MVSRCGLEVLQNAACEWVESNLNVGSIAEAEEGQNGRTARGAAC